MIDKIADQSQYIETQSNGVTPLPNDKLSGLYIDVTALVPPDMLIYTSQSARDVTDWKAMWEQRGRRLEMLSDAYANLATAHIDTQHQRDMLARRCAEQARHIEGLLNLKAEEAAEAEAHPLADAIAVMQRNGHAR